MNTFTSIYTQQDADDVRNQARVNREVPVLAGELGPLVLDPADFAAPLTPPDSVFDEPNLFLAAAFDRQTVNIACTPWTTPLFPPVRLELWMDNLLRASRTVNTTTPTPADCILSVDLRVFPAGPYMTFIKAIADDGNEQTTTQVPVEVLSIDNRRPNFGQATTPATFPPLVVQEGVTKAYLAAHSNKVVVTIPHYFKKRRGDTITYYLGGNPPDEAGGVEGTHLVMEPVEIPDPAPSYIELDGSVFEGLGDGHWYFGYTITDRQGFKADMNLLASVDVILTDPPVVTRPPEVDLAVDGLDLKDAFDGVWCRIPPYDNHLPTDRAIISWGGFDLPVGTMNVVPKEFPVDWAVLNRNGAGPDTLAVTYSIARTANSTPVTSPPLDVDYDFTYPGPPNPNEPDPVNPDLPLVDVKGGAWQAGDDLNKLTVADVGQDATAYFVLTDGFATGDVLSLYFGQNQTPVVLPPLTNPSVGDTVTFIIPWSVIAVSGYGFLPVRYSVSNATAGNPVFSEATTVDCHVTSIPNLPGLTFRDAYMGGSYPTYNCASHPIFPGFFIDVIGDSNFANGDTVTVITQGYEIDNTTVIPNTDKRFTVPLNANSANQGFACKIEPYAGFLELISVGYIRVYYTLAKADGTAPGTSVVNTARISRQIEGGLCSPAP